MLVGSDAVMIQIAIDRVRWGQVQPSQKEGNVSFYVRCGTCDQDADYCPTSNCDIKWGDVRTAVEPDYPCFHHGPQRLALEKDHSLVFYFFAEEVSTGTARPASTQSPINPTSSLKTQNLSSPGPNSGVSACSSCHTRRQQQL